ncbi:response regulator transcription factor [Sulfurimonas sp. SAG-AH-194-L11]|nr:response regulator transcription factor [Sulfurimonas sp. SAG-AH-194-L11]MDF1876797.1 response regulator transcription factor [Sulfurimonas sp. SAG-AH-194-L11]
MNILIVEDNELTAKQLYKLLQSEKYICDIANGYLSAQKILDTNKYSLILLDWNLGDGDGLELLKTLRAQELTTPVLMLSANSEINDKVSVLDSGADDYLCKPYSSVELLARIRALLRRESSEKNSLINIQNVTLDTIARDVYINDIAIKLTTAEFDLLELFMQHPNQVITRYQLSEHINKNNYSIKHSNLVDVHIKNLRKKLNNKDFIINVRGVGYKVIK